MYIPLFSTSFCTACRVPWHHEGRRYSAQAEASIQSSKRKNTIPDSRQAPKPHLEFWGNASKVLNISTLSDWYSVSRKTLIKLDGMQGISEYENSKKELIVRASGASFLDKKYHGSMWMALKEAYPHHEWVPWKFTRTDRDFWASGSNVRMFLESVASQLMVLVLDSRGPVVCAE